LKKRKGLKYNGRTDRRPYESLIVELKNDLKYTREGRNPFR
jgi:hypothetical protein